MLIRRTVSPKSRFESAAPPQPDSLEITIANRGSVAPAHRDVLPSREWPMSDDLLRVDLGDRFERVERPGEAPGPGRDRAPLVGGGAGLAGLIEERLDPVLKPVVEVRVDIAVVGGHERIAPRQHALDLPPRAAGPSGRVGGSVVFDAVRRIVGHPAAGQRDSRVAVNRVVPLEVEPQERRHAA